MKQQSLHHAVQGFLDSMDAYTFKYKDPRDEPTDQPTGQDYLGIMAQDLEKSPTGKTLVKQDPTGKKYLETGAMISALAAAVSHLNKRLHGVEGKRGRGK